MAIAVLARHASTLSSRRLAEQVHVPLPVLTNVLNQLLHHGLVVSVRGAQGGYRLARKAVEISLVDVIEAIEGPSRLAQCCSEREKAATPANGECNLEPR